MVSLKGKIIMDKEIDFHHLKDFHLVSEVSTKEKYTLGQGNIHIGVIDCGI